MRAGARDDGVLPLMLDPECDHNLRRHAAPFLAGLLRCPVDDAWMEAVTFQTFDDAKPNGESRPGLTHVLHGSLEDLAMELTRLNRAGAGVFVTVNGTDGRGRKKDNIITLRAHHADLDVKCAAVPYDPAALPLAPSMEVRTPGGHHLYWLPTTPMPCPSAERRAEHEAEVKGVAQALLPYGGDLKACDVARVLRVPGFYHHKAEPRLVELVHNSGPRYAREEVVAAFPPVKAEGKPGGGAGSRVCPMSKIPTIDRAKVLERAGKYVETMPQAVSGEGGHDATFNAALKVQDGFDLTEDEALEVLLDAFNPRCSPPWTPEELRRKVQQAAQYCRDRGHLLRESRETRERAQECTSHGATGSDRPMVKGFEWGGSGLFQVKERRDADGNPIDPERTWIAPPFTLPGLVRNDASESWRLLMRWTDPDRVLHEEALAFETLTGEGAELARTLGQGGLVLPPDPGKRRILLRYLTDAVRKIQGRVRSVETLGWIDGAFVLPSGEVVGHAGESYRFAGDIQGSRSYPTRGTLDGWRQGVAAYAVGNPRLMFALACAFAGPLLDLVRPDGGGGFNLMGASSRGKSTCLECAASVWGRPDPLPTWRATSSGLEGIAGARNDGFLALDEMSQADPKEVATSAYMLANGSPKARAQKDGSARPMRQWRLVFLSTGEQGLEDKLVEEGKHARAGQDVRVPDVPCPIEGMFKTPHDLPDLESLARHLKAQARTHYGHAIRAFLEKLTAEWSRRAELQDYLKALERDFLKSVLPKVADAQVRRVAGRFALVAVAGELAQSMGILPWPSGESARAAAECFKEWFDRRGFAGSSEAHRGVESVLAFIEKHGSSRFDEWGDKDARIINRAGTRKRADAPADGWDYFMTSEAWAEATRGFQARDVARACIARGILEPGAGDKAAKSMSIPGHGKARAYVIRASAMAAYQDGGTV